MNTGLKGTPRFRLRWRFDYVDGKVRCGIWNNSGSQQGRDGAWNTNKTGLIRATVEGETLPGIPYQIVPMLECDGHNFVNFEWVAVAPIPGMFGGGSVTVAGQIIGLTLVTEDESVSAFVDGSVAKRMRSLYEKQNKLGAWRA